jgi:hypothetical protein
MYVIAPKKELVVKKFCIWGYHKIWPFSSGREWCSKSSKKSKALKEKSGYFRQTFLLIFSKNKRLHFASLWQFLQIFRYSHPWYFIFSAGNSNSLRKYAAMCKKICRNFEKVRSVECLILKFDRQTICPHFSFSTLEKSINLSKMIFKILSSVSEVYNPKVL